ncbi:MAG TPA: cytidylate kinase-like family protein [Vicinamibacterales bacterium]|nr:cytidylate kinase-like family protein [Vicinamibacterales bacterium]
MAPSAHLVVAISRQIGSGGAEVGRRLAQRLGIHYADRNILEQAARMLGKDERDLEGLEERVASLWGRAAGILSLGAPEGPYVTPALLPAGEDDLFLVESQIIREIAAREDAVIVGRGAPWLLRDHPRLLSVLLHAPKAWRVARIQQVRGMAEEDAGELVREVDQQRARFTQSLRSGSQTDARCYHVCLDTSVVGIDASVDLLATLAAAR